MENTVLALIVLFILLLIYHFISCSRLRKQIKTLTEVLEMQNITIANLETSEVAAKDVLDHFSAHEEVIERMKSGESRESISKALKIPVNKIELIIKFDKIKKEQSNVT